MHRNRLFLIAASLLITSCGRSPETSSSDVSSKTDISNSSLSSGSASSSSSSSSTSSIAPIQNEYFEFTKFGDTLALSKVKKTEKVMTIPGTFENMPVTTVLEGVFRDKTKIEKLILSEGIESIERYAFYGCTNLEEIAFSHTLKTIGDYAFGSVPYIKNVNLVEGLERIGDCAFVLDEELTSVSLPSSLKWIGSSVFLGCNKLLYTTENGVDYLGNSTNKYLYAAKKSDDNIAPKSLTINEATTIIGGSILEKESTVENVIIPANVVSIGIQAFASTSITSITIPSKVEEIGAYAFSGCAKLTTCTIEGSSLKTIQHEAFSGAKALTSISLPESVTYVGPSAFTEAYESSSLSYNEDGKGGRYLGNEKNPYHVLVGVTDSAIKTLAINEKTKVIAGEALRAVSEVKNLTIPASVASIGDNAFFQMVSLESIVIPENVTLMGEGLFGSCSELKTIDLKNAPTTIGTGFAVDCPKLESFKIPSSVQKIKTLIINRCTSLRTLVIPASVVQIASSAINGTNVTIDGKDYGLTIYLEANTKGALFEKGWSSNATWVYGNEWHYENGVPTLNK